MYRRRGGRGGNLWLWMMALQNGMQFLQLNERPPVTFGLIAANALVYFRPLDLDSVLPPTKRVCLLPKIVLRDWDLVRVMVSPWYHADDTHLVYNMVSLLWKGAQLESILGSERFAVSTGALLVLSNALHVGLARMLGGQFLTECSIGFSSVLFAFKTILAWDSPTFSNFYGITVPTKYAAWAELLIIQMLVPQTSFLGHLSGILAGLAFLHTRSTASGLWRAVFGRWGEGGGRSRRSVGGQQSRQRRTWGSGTAARPWGCKACTYVNEGGRLACEMCETPCNAATPQAPQVVPPVVPPPLLSQQHQQHLTGEELRRARLTRFMR